MRIAGSWTITHTWPENTIFGPEEARYDFHIKFRDDGAVNAVAFLFFGAWTQSDGASGVHFALTGGLPHSLTLYEGTVSETGNEMSGTMRGLGHLLEHVHNGQWTAVRRPDDS